MYLFSCMACKYTLYIIWLWCMLIYTEFDSRALLALLKCLLITNLKIWHSLSLLHPCRSLLPLSPSGGCEVFLWCYSTDLTMWQRKSHKTTQMCRTLQVQYAIYVLCGLWLTIKFIYFNVCNIIQLIVMFIIFTAILQIVITQNERFGLKIICSIVRSQII